MPAAFHHEVADRLWHMEAVEIVPLLDTDPEAIGSDPSHAHDRWITTVGAQWLSNDDRICERDGEGDPAPTVIYLDLSRSQSLSRGNGGWVGPPALPR